MADKLVAPFAADDPDRDRLKHNLGRFPNEVLNHVRDAGNALADVYANAPKNLDNISQPGFILHDNFTKAPMFQIPASFRAMTDGLRFMSRRAFGRPDQDELTGYYQEPSQWDDPANSDATRYPVK